jgi:hypothetical protein
MTTLEAYPMAPVLGEKRPSSGFVEGLALFTMGIVLFPMANALTPFLGTMVVGILALAGITVTMFRKYRGRWQFNAEVAFVIGMAIQYLLAPILIRVISWDFTADLFYVQTSAERVAVKEYYAHGMVIILVFAGIYFIVSSMIPLKRTLREVTGELPTYFTKRSYVVYLVMIVLLWVTRVSLLAIGAYYHGFAVRHRELDPRYSGWTQYDSGLGPVCVAFVFAAALTRKLNWAIAGTYVFADFMWNFTSGSREKTVTPFLVMLFVYVVYRNRVPWKFLILSALPALLLLGFMDLYRSTVFRFSDVDRISFSQVMYALTRAKGTSESAGMGATLAIGINRLNDLEPISEIYRNVPEMHPYLDGETYAMIPMSLVPRALWPDKPKVAIGINNWFFRHDIGSSPITVMGEGFLNFGWPGVLLAAAASALILRLIDRLMVRFVNNLAMLPVYIGFVAYCARVHTQPMMMWISSLIKVIAVALVVHMLTQWFGERQFATQPAPASGEFDSDDHAQGSGGTAPAPNASRNGHGDYF